MDAIDCLKTRRSIRKYKDKTVPDEVIEDIIDCALSAPSSCDTQPWSFVIVKAKEKLKALSKVQKWASFVENANFCIIPCMREGKYLFEPSKYFSMACCIENILLAVHAQGLGCCWTYIKDFNEPEIEENVRKILGIPENVEVICLLPIGYPDEHPKNHKIKDKKDVVYFENWKK